MYEMKKQSAVKTIEKKEIRLKEIAEVKWKLIVGLLKIPYSDDC
jgi:hypothetical protein